MAVSEQERHALHSKLVEVFGVREAATMKELMPPVEWDNVATSRDLDQHIAVTRADIAEFRGEVRGEIAALRSETRSESAEVRSEIAALRSGTRSEFAEVRSEIAALGGETRSEFAEVRSEIAALGGEMHRSMARMTWTMTIGMFATVIAAASFAFTAGVAM